MGSPKLSPVNHRNLVFNSLVFVVALMVSGCNGASESLPEVTGFESGRVSRVIDGDTVELTDGRRIRYLEIDTPETVHPDKPVECFGPEATQRNRELVEGRDVELLSDGPDMDQFGRYLRYVFVEGTFVNAELVWEGYAVASSYGHQGRLFQTLVQLQRAAQEGNTGLWAVC